MELAEDATAMGNPHAASDGYSAGTLLFAGALAAMANVRINAAGLKDEAKGQGLVDRVRRPARRGRTSFCSSSRRRSSSAWRPERPRARVSHRLRFGAR